MLNYLLAKSEYVSGFSPGSRVTLDIAHAWTWIGKVKPNTTVCQQQYLSETAHLISTKLKGQIKTTTDTLRVV